jgi:hypothetical protein
MYVDEDGEVWWLIPVIAAEIFAIGNTAAHAIRGDINNFWDGLKYFGQGAITGFALGSLWQFTGPAYLTNLASIFKTTGTVVHNAMTYYAVAKVGLGVVGTIGGAFNDGWKGVGNGAKAFLGNFYLDENHWLGGIWQGFSRHSWEMLQSFIGEGYTHIRNIAGNVDRVDYLGGATFATNEHSDHNNGVSLGNFINTNIDHEIAGNFDDYVLSNPMYMHEYGHTIDSRAFGLSYLFAIGMPSFISAAGDGNHSKYWTEKRANRRAKSYFGKYYGIDWNTAVSPYYIGTFEDNHPTH